MSGGSMDYLSYKVEDASFPENTPERAAFRLHLKKVAEALHRIEWNDSGDGAQGEDEAIRGCLAKDSVLHACVADAYKAKAALQRELDRLANI